MIPHHLSQWCHHTRVFVIVLPPREGVSLVLKQTRSSSRALVVTPGDTGGPKAPSPWCVHTHSSSTDPQQETEGKPVTELLPLKQQPPRTSGKLLAKKAPGRARRPETKLSCVAVYTQVSHTRFWVRCGHINDESSSPCPKTPTRFHGSLASHSAEKGAVF